MSNTLKRIIIVVLAIILVGVIIFGVVRFITNEEAGKPTPQPNTAQQANPPEASNGNQNRDIQPSPTQPNPPSSATTSPNLSRSGPEHIAGLFVIATAGAYIFSLRRAVGRQNV